MQLNQGYTPATIDVRASVDFGRTYTNWITTSLDGNSSFMEKKINFNLLGKQVRFNVRCSNPLIFESLQIGIGGSQYNAQKYDR
jgi:hypothetical protein